MLFDGHSDIWTDVTKKRLLGEKEVFRKYHLNEFKKANINGGIFVIWIDPPYDKNPKQRVSQIVSCIKDEIEESKDIFNIIKCFNDIKIGTEKNKINTVIGMEGLSHIGKDVDLLDYYYNNIGARHASLTWNEQNDLATGCRGDENRGLTKEGKQAVKKLEDLKMLVDVSHLNEKSFWDLISVATKPVIASHSNAKALCNATRNLTDAQLKEIAKTGGVVGMNSFRDFVGENANTQNVEKLVDHVDYIVNLIGIEHVACGFDFNDYLDSDVLGGFATIADSPGIDGLKTTYETPNVIAELKNRGYRDSDIKLISYGNFYRVLKEVL